LFYQLFYILEKIINGVNKLITYQAPVFHGTALEVCDGDGVVLRQRVADAEVVLVKGDRFDAYLQSELTLLKINHC